MILKYRYGTWRAAAPSSAISRIVVFDRALRVPLVYVSIGLAKARFLAKEAASIARALREQMVDFQRSGALTPDMPQICMMPDRR